MDARAVAWRRLAMMAAAVTAVTVLAMPSAALGKAKAATRFVVASQTVVDWSTSSSATTPVISVKLQKKSGTKWVALKGTIKAYYWDAVTSTWIPDGSITGSNAGLIMPIRGKYKLTYGGSSTTKSTYSYTKRIDTIGETIGPVDVSFTDIDTTWEGVSVSYDVDWNTLAFPIYPADEHLEFGYWGTFENDTKYSGSVYFYQDLWEPGTVTFTYRVRKADIDSDDTFDTEAWFISQDDYIRVSTNFHDESTPKTF
jgi:hypothetical protein